MLLGYCEPSARPLLYLLYLPSLNTLTSPSAWTSSEVGELGRANSSQRGVGLGLSPKGYQGTQSEEILKPWEDILKYYKIFLDAWFL